MLIVITSQGMGELIGAAILSVKRAGLMASLVLMLVLLTGGYYVQHIPKFMMWLKHISFMHYGFRLLLKVQYSQHLVYDCQSKGRNPPRNELKIDESRFRISSVKGSPSHLTPHPPPHTHTKISSHLRPG
ncbi:hypothetical protein OPV22_009323 [Ensete ventricosum]|uniref:ABC-2 type transporter transmembrane domain-containing protein n=1 Tax=Ensete ventricosum TaxID=4639 RepID=A0AAV8RER9_ENSVE|nr:hypothetical protein OPV22_009323 [Ensete ventricosum]